MARRKVRFRFTDDPKRHGRYRAESDSTGQFAPVVVGLDAADVEKNIARLRSHGCEVEDARAR